MKKLISISLITAIISSVICFAGNTNPVADVIGKIMALPIVGSIITEKSVDAAADDVISVIKDYGEPDFRMAYYNARSATFGQESLNMMHQAYDSARAVIVARVKEYLHGEKNLLTLYSAHRDSFRLKLSSLTPEEKKRAKLCIATARATFLEFKQPESVKKFVELRQTESDYYRKHLYLAEDLLEKNVPAAELAQALSNDTLDSKVLEETRKSFSSMFLDTGMAKFVGRRAIEGGDALLDKYLEVLALMAQDIPVP